MFDMFTGNEERKLTGGNLIKTMLARIDQRLSPSLAVRWVKGRKVR